MSWTRTVTTYTGPSQIAVRKGICPVCGKRGRRQTTIQHTVSPFNKNPDGSVRTYAEVSARVKVEATEWAKEPFVHAKCEKARRKK